MKFVNLFSTSFFFFVSTIRLMTTVTAAALVLSFTSQASAGLYLNPYLSYEAAALTLKTGSATGNQSLAMALTGSGIGGVIAYSLPALLYLGVDYSTSTLNASSSTDPLGLLKSTTANRTTLFAVVGAKLIFLKAWAGMSLSDSVDATDLFALKGSAMKAGLAWSMLPLVDINFEYIIHTYKDFSSASASYTLGDDQLYSAASFNTLQLSVSLPLNL